MTLKLLWDVEGDVVTGGQISLGSSAMLKGWDLYLKSMAKNGNILQWLMACLHCCFKIIVMATMWELEIGELAEHL